MTKAEIIKKLDELREEIACCSIEEVTDYAREKAYICVVDAIDLLKANEE